MNPLVVVRLTRRLAVLWLLAAPFNALAGGSGLSTLLIVNTADAESLALGNHYAERRAIPPSNILRVHWPGSRVQWTLTEFSNTLWTPLTNAIALRGLSSQIDRVVLTLSLPYRVTTPTEGANSTTSVVLYGFKGDTRNLSTCPLATNSVNTLAGTEASFALEPAVSSTGPSFLATLLTAGSLEQAMELVDRGVASDGTFPTHRVLLAKTTDVARSVRHVLFDNAIFNASVLGNAVIERTNSNATSGFGTLLGFQTGLAQFAVPTNTFAPGAMADSLTSFGGFLFDPAGQQTNALEFIHAGAAGSFGTIVEPCNYLEKFPSPMIHFHQSRGFSLAECYALSLTNPYQGLIVGEPLASPFALAGDVAWTVPETNAALSGVTNLSVNWTAADATRPLQRFDLFVDGAFHSTLTNIAPAQNNIVRVTINGRQMNYTVPEGATVASVATGVAAVLNSPGNQFFTDVEAAAFGDRIELQSTDTAVGGDNVSIVVTNLQGSATDLSTFGRTARATFLDSVAFGTREFLFSGSAGSGAVISTVITRTNSTTVTVAVTNSSGGTLDLGTFVGSFVNALNATAALQTHEGCVAGDFTASGGVPRFFLRARTAGWPASSIRADFNVSGGVSVSNSSNIRLDENIGDLRPRNHLYIAAGATNGTLGFALDTTLLADGHHELTVVAHEGSHVRTQTRATVPVIVQNHALTAALTVSNLDTTSAAEGAFAIHITASAPDITSIELHSQGGRFGVVSDAASATFHFTGAEFGRGRVPFHALVTDTDGNRYRTAEFVTRFIGLEAELSPLVTNVPPFQLAWPGVAGREYDILSTDDLAVEFQPVATVTASNSVQTLWQDGASGGVERRFYKLRATP